MGVEHGSLDDQFLNTKQLFSHFHDDSRVNGHLMVKPVYFTEELSLSFTL